MELSAVRGEGGNAVTVKRTAGGFTLVELLVVIAIIALLASLMAPAVMRSLDSSRSVACSSNLRQLALANHAYALDTGTFVAAAEDIWSANKKRWHGTRAGSGAPFDPALSPLLDYMGVDKRIKECPLFKPDAAGFESGCGGYGYNVRGVGSQSYLLGVYAGANKGMPPDLIQNPAKTVMFTDAAFLQSQRSGKQLVEYSFSEAYFHVADTKPVESYKAMPSIHFRHNGHANVAWVDGHVSSEEISTEYNPAYTERGFGWFGPADNSLFDPY